MYARQVSRKINIFCVFYEKDKEMSCEKLFLSTKTHIFPHDTKNIDFPQDDFMSTYNVEMYASIFNLDF
jgi:hypothetical protein